MYEKHYVVQRLWHNYETWETLEQKYKSPEEAYRAIEQKPKGPYYRVAESYVQIRYKAVEVK